VQKAQAKRRTQEIKKALDKLPGAEHSSKNGALNISANEDLLVSRLVTKTEVDMNNYASSTATDFMEAYYKVNATSKIRRLVLTCDRWP
jgi:hypothetical protein